MYSLGIFNDPYLNRSSGTLATTARVKQFADTVPALMHSVNVSWQSRTGTAREQTQIFAVLTALATMGPSYFGCPSLQDGRKTMKLAFKYSLPYKKAKRKYEATNRLTKADKAQMQGQVKELQAKLETSMHSKQAPQQTNTERHKDPMKNKGSTRKDPERCSLYGGNKRED